MHALALLACCPEETVVVGCGGDASGEAFPPLPWLVVPPFDRVLVLLVDGRSGVAPVVAYVTTRADSGSPAQRGC